MSLISHNNDSTVCLASVFCRQFTSGYFVVVFAINVCIVRDRDKIYKLLT